MIVAPVPGEATPPPCVPAVFSLNVQLIIVDPTQTNVINRPCHSGDGEVDFGELTAPDGGFILRARGRRVVTDGPDLLFYTNPVRILVRTS